MLKRTFLAALTVFVLSACGRTEPAKPAVVDAPSQTASSGSSLIERINNQGVISVGTEGTYAPFTYHDQNGHLTGYDVEVTRAVAKKLGVQVEFKETQWDAMLAGLKANRFDLVANQVALTSPERQATFDKSVAYSWSGPMMLGRQDETRIDSLVSIRGLKAAQTLSSNYGEMAVAAGAQVVPVDGMAQALTLVQQQRADVTLNDTLSLLDYLKKNPDSGLKVVWQADGGSKVGAGLVLNKGQDEVLAKINQAMEMLHQDGTLAKLSEQFFGRDVSKR